MRRFKIVWLFAAVLAVGCGSSPTSPSAVNGAAGSSSERVGLLGAPPAPEIGPGAGTGTQPIAGAPNSCPMNTPRLAINANNGKVDLFVREAIAGLTVGYLFQVKEADKPNILEQIVTLVTDGRGGLYAQPKSLPVGKYLARVQATRRGCGATDAGTWSEWVPFAIDGKVVPPAVPATVPAPPPTLLS